MMRLFVRRQDSRPSSGPGSAPPGRRIRPIGAHDGGRGPRPRRSIRACSWPQVPLVWPTRRRPPTCPTMSRGAETLLRSEQDPRHLRGDRHRRAGRPTQGYGLGNVASGAAAAADTRFDIGSVTKTFTAVGILLLYQQSQGTSHPLDLNAPISQYLHNTPSFKLPRKWSGVTTMELLDMTSGIRNASNALPWQAQVESVAKAPLLFAPGTKTSYSDTNYDLLGEIIEQWTGEPYGTFIQDQILEPLGMSETEELGRSATVPNQAVGYDGPKHGKWPRATMQNGSAMYAAAGMVSTAQDMATYMTALLSGGLLDPATYA